MPRLSWQLKVILPVAVVLVNGLLLFVLATTSFENAQRQAVLVVATAGAVILCAVFLLMLALIVREPMKELSAKIERIRAGDLDVSLDFAARNDEIGDLGKAFNGMIRELRESREEIERLHKTQMSRAEHLATLGELAAGLAHEIRNPLAGIAGVMEIIGRDLPLDSPARDVLKEVRFEVQHINRIVTDLLETARPKAPQFRRADLNSTAEHAVMFAQQQVRSKQIQIELVKSETLPPVEHDTAQIHQVLLNLLLNAIQAIEHRGKVRLEVCSDHAGFAVLKVSDTGKGIATEHLGNIFRPFFTTKGHGTGLGLSLARRIVEDHGGHIEVQSAPGHGSTFVIYLPLRAAAVGAQT
ncbi:MAG: PAS domain-containing sensor histidine kinase [Terriglobales bacterium]